MGENLNMPKYPGSFLINEVGTRKELAAAYGVSERTIYRWLNKAAKESGISSKAKTRKPRLSTLEKFTGTRKALAKKYGVSERTAYRWLKEAREKGAQLPTRKPTSKYPGAEVINNIMINSALTNKQIGDMFGVSSETAGRWIRRARLEQPSLLPDLRKTGDYKLRRTKAGSYYEKIEPEDIGEPWEVLPPDEDIGEPWEVLPPDKDIGEPWEVPPPDEEDFYSENFSDDFIEKSNEEYTQDILESLIEFDMISRDSLLFTQVPPEMRIPYLMEYIYYQKESNPKAFYDVFGDWTMGLDEQIKDKMGMISINIWGDELENWLENQIEIDNI